MCLLPRWHRKTKRKEEQQMALVVTLHLGLGFANGLLGRNADFYRRRRWCRRWRRRRRRRRRGGLENVWRSRSRLAIRFPPTGPLFTRPNRLRRHLSLSLFLSFSLSLSPALRSVTFCLSFVIFRGIQRIRYPPGCTSFRWPSEFVAFFCLTLLLRVPHSCLLALFAVYALVRV